MHLQSFTRSGVLFQLFLFICVTPGMAFPEEINVTGSVYIKINTDAAPTQIQGGRFTGAILERAPHSVSLKKDGSVVARAEFGSGKSVRLINELGGTNYLFVDNGGSYFLRREDQTTPVRAMLKDETCMIYDMTGRRTLRGRQNGPIFSLQDQEGEELLKIRGTASVRESSLFSIPIEEQYRILLWAVNYMK